MTHRAIDYYEDSASAGTCGSAVHEEGFLEHRGYGRHNEGEMHWEASGHDRIDCEFLRRDRAFPDGFYSNQMVGR